MLFNSFQFVFLFFPIVTAGYFVLPQRFRWAWLLAASCYFYMAFVPAYILILAGTIVIDYFAGIAIERSVNPWRRTLLIISIVSNVGVLFFFKYFDFFNGSVSHVAHLIGWNYPIPLLKILLPIGLSFHTFQAMSYTIEVYRGNQKAERHFGIYSLYVMFYPQLVAGPIERPQNLLHQFREIHSFDAVRVTAGLQRMAWGMFKKVVIADRLAVLTGLVFDRPRENSGLSFLVATIFFGYQIYCDFSGYTDIALGAAQVMGFTLMENFNRPYAATSVADFWRRWHISLSSWFRDYVYIGLGGNRVSLPRWHFNILVVFLLSGLWHGANWTFAAWGLLHAGYLLGSHLTAPLRQRVADLIRLTRVPALHRWMRIGITFGLVSFAWIFFRAASLRDALYIARHLFVDTIDYVTHVANSHAGNGRINSGLPLLAGNLLICLILIGGLEAIHLLQNRISIRQAFARWPMAARWATYQLALLGFILLSGPRQRAFIYFQF